MQQKPKRHKDTIRTGARQVLLLHRTKQCESAGWLRLSTERFRCDGSCLEIGYLIRNRNFDRIRSIARGVKHCCTDWIARSRYKPQLISLIRSNRRQVADGKEPAFLLLVPKNSSTRLNSRVLPCKVHNTDASRCEHRDGAPLV